MTRNITLSAEESLIEAARNRAKQEHKSLNVVFRDWLQRYAAGRKAPGRFANLMQELSYALPGARFSREEMNER